MGQESRMIDRCPGTAIRYRQLRGFALSLLVLTLLLAGCASPSDRSDDRRQGGFYGGVSAGATMR